jgi:DNA-binding NtrC family response regulator
MREIFKKLAIVAPTDETVIIFGETGTGKEHIAGTIHENSPRRAGPFIAVSCAALIPALLESELFGHEKGAFTGANNRKLGRFERASGGTLFLDEIDDIPTNLQVKLLRVLQEKEFERVGGTETIKTDIRTIAATQSDLRKKIDEGTFREDLYYRLNVLPISLPPLRERKADIPLFVEHYLAEFCPPGRNIGVEPSALQLLIDYSWPGNIRELRHLIKRLIVMGECKDITTNMLPDEITEDTGLSDAGCFDNLSFDEAVSKLERNMMVWALKEAGGNKTKAAALLKIAPTTFRDKLSKYQI